MRQKTNENKSTSCVYQELNPEMDAFLAGYLEDGRHRGLRESTIHLHDKIGHYFLSAVTETGCLKPQEMDAHSIGACLPENPQQVVSFTYPHFSPVCLSFRIYRQGLQRCRPSL